MIELPRAALLASQIAEVAEFFSFGTNDLTQTTMGLSRDDAGRFLPEYVDEDEGRHFQDRSLPDDRSSRRRAAGRVGHEERPEDASEAEGRNLRRARRRCGKRQLLPQGGTELRSASPFRVPISRLAAAQAVIESK